MSPSDFSYRVRCSTLLSLLLLVAASATAGTNRWTSEGPYGGVVIDLAQDASDPAVLYAATDSAGVWKSIDGAQSWFPANSGLDRVERQIRGIETHPTVAGIVYVSTSGHLHRSTDGGASWVELGDPLPMNGEFAIAPSNGDVLYYGNPSEGLLRSSDGGSTWTASGLGVGKFFADLAVDPNDEDTVYANFWEEGLYKSTDGGSSAQRIDQGLAARFLLTDDVVIDPRDTDHLYWVHDRKAYRSLDGGLQWSQVGPANLRIRSAAFDPRFPGRVYLGPSFSDQVVWSDDGEQWLSSPLDKPDGRIADFAFGPQGTSTIYLADIQGDGILRSDDDLGWELAHRGMAASTVWGFASDPAGPRVFAAASNGIHRRESPGAPWELLTGSREHGRCCHAVHVDPDQPDTVFALSEVGVLRSLDGGDSWETANAGRLGPFNTLDLVFHPNRTSTLYIAASDGIYRSRNSAQSWHLVGEVPHHSTVRSLVVDPLTPSTVYAASSTRVFKSLDSGESWVWLDNLTVSSLEELVLDPRAPGILYAVTSREIAFSLDGGATWDPLEADGLPDFHRTLVVDPRDPSTLLVGNHEDLWRSTDGGTTFELYEGGTGRETSVLGVLIDDGPVRTIYAGFNEGAAVSLTRGCVDGDKVLCLDDQAGDKRFAVSIRYDTDLGGGFEGDAQATSLAPIGIADGGILSFFEPSNPEALVKLIDGCGFNGHYWVFAAATTSVGFELTVEDTLARETRVYSNPDDTPAATITDTEGFATCDVSEDEAWTVGQTSQTREEPVRSHAPNRQHIEPPTKTTTDEGCTPDTNTLCIDDEPGDRRFAIRLHFDSDLGGGQEGDAMATSLAPLGITDGGILSFFQVSLPEVLVKVIDGCGFNDNFWVFYAATTNLGFEMTVEDTRTGTVRTYTNPDGVPATTVTDVDALPVCDA